MADNNFVTRYSGNFRPVRTYRETKSAYEDEIVIGKRGPYFSVFRVRLLEPTPQYPLVYVSLSLGNGRDSSFAQIKVEEFNSLVAKVSQWQARIMELDPVLENKSAVYLAAREQQDQQLTLVQRMMGGDEADFSAEKVAAIIKALQAQQPQDGGSNDAQ